MIAYLEKFLALVERFVASQERRNEIMSLQTSHTIITADDKVKTTLAQDVATAEKNVSTTESASNGSASGAATGQTGRGRSRASAAGTATATAETPAETTQADAGATAGNRRQRVRAADVATTEATAENAEGTTAPAGNRRQRTRASSATETTSAPAQEQRKPEPEYDTPEQADDRAEIENLCQLAGDVDAANDEVKEYLAGKGWNVAVNIPSDDVETALDDLNVIIDKYFQ